MTPPVTDDRPRLYDDEGDLLLQADRQADRVILLPAGNPKAPITDRDRIRIQWGQHLLADIMAGRYRTVICGVNDADNTHGIIGELLDLVPTSQWSTRSATSFAKMFHQSVAVHAAEDREPYILKFDLDRLLVLGILRPQGREHFTLEDLERGFNTINKMLMGRRERWPTATVSFLGAKSNRLLGPDGRKLGKSHGSTELRALRAAGWTPGRVWRLLLPMLGCPGEALDDAGWDPAAVPAGPFAVDDEGRCIQPPTSGR